MVPEQVAIDPNVFKRAASSFPSGVAVVTSGHGDRVHGITVSAFASLSLDPPQVLVCVARFSKLNEIVLASNKLAVSILASDQAHLSALFSKPGRDPVVSFTDIEVPHAVGVSQSPIIEGSAAFFDCSVAMAAESGDHSVFFADVLAVGVDETKTPLLYFDRKYRTMLDPDEGTPS